MAATDAPLRLGSGWLPAAVEISAEAGWNQVEGDWRLFMDAGEVWGIVRDDRLLATAAIMPYGASVAWIGMVLTRIDSRGGGLGTLLLRHCIARVEAEGRLAGLDATPAGEPIYRGLGFAGAWLLSRWRGEGGGQAASGKEMVSSDAANLEATDAAAFGAGRSALVRDLASRSPIGVLASVSGRCHATARTGRTATQIGPVIGPLEEAADFVDALLGRIAGPVLLDVPDAQDAVSKRLSEQGFRVERPFLRMTRGLGPCPSRLDRTIAIAGPEFG